MPFSPRWASTEEKGEWRLAVTMEGKRYSFIQQDNQSEAQNGKEDRCLTEKKRIEKDASFICSVHIKGIDYFW